MYAIMGFNPQKNSVVDDFFDSVRGLLFPRAPKLYQICNPYEKSGKLRGIYQFR